MKKSKAFYKLFVYPDPQKGSRKFSFLYLYQPSEKWEKDIWLEENIGLRNHKKMNVFRLLQILLVDYGKVV